MPFPWSLILKIVAMILRILGGLPPDVDNTAACRDMATILDTANGTASLTEDPNGQSR